MIVSLMQFYQTLKGQSSLNTRPGTCTTHHLIWTLFSYTPVKYFLTNSVETRTDPDQLVCQKPASLDLCCF